MDKDRLDKSCRLDNRPGYPIDNGMQGCGMTFSLMSRASAKCTKNYVENFSTQAILMLETNAFLF